jgi:hypothetical protein
MAITLLEHVVSHVFGKVFSRCSRHKMVAHLQSRALPLYKEQQFDLYIGCICTIATFPCNAHYTSYIINTGQTVWTVFSTSLGQCSRHSLWPCCVTDTVCSITSISAWHSYLHCVCWNWFQSQTLIKLFHEKITSPISQLQLIWSIASAQAEPGILLILVLIKTSHLIKAVPLEVQLVSLCMGFFTIFTGGCSWPDK